MFFKGLLLGMAALGVAGGAFAAENGLKLTYDMGGDALSITKDAAGTVQLDGLPYPGLVIYRPDTRVVYYQHPDEPAWLAIKPDDVRGYGVSATLVAGAAWQPYMDAPTQRWVVKAAQMECDNWFASAKAGAVAGLNAADLTYVLTALQWLHAGVAAVPCERLNVTAQQGAQVGLPLYFTGPNGRWQLTDLSQGAVEPIVLPAAPQPADDAARLRILLYQFSPEDRQGIIKQVGKLPLSQQLQEIQKMLGDTATY